MTLAVDVDRARPQSAGLVRKFSWIAISGFGRQFAFFAINGYLAYCLTKETFGTLTCAFSTLMVFIGLADFGLRQVGWREVARRPHQIAEIVNVVLAARLLMTAVALAGYLVAAAVYCHNGRGWGVFLIYSLGLFFNMTSFDFPFLGRDRMDVLGRCFAISYAYFLPACLLTVRGESTAWLVPVHFVVAHAILFMLLYREYRCSVGPLRLCVDRQHLKHCFRESWSLGINSLLFRTAVNYPVLLLGFAVSSVAAAEYRLAEIFFGLFTSLGLYLGSSTFTTYATYRGEKDERLVDSITVAVQMILLCMIPVAILFVTALPSILDTALNTRSPDLALTCQLLGLCLPLAVTTRYLQTCLPSVGLNRELVHVNLVNLVLGLAIGSAMLFSLGSWGVAASVLASETVVLSLLLVAVRTKLPALRFGQIFAAPIASGAICVMVYLAAVSFAMPPSVAVALPLIIACACAWQLNAARRRVPSNTIAIPRDDLPSSGPHRTQSIDRKAA